LKHLFKKILFWGNLIFALALIAAYAGNYVNPAYFWPFAFFGLAYPLLLLINIGFCLFWILKKDWAFLVSLLVIIAGWSNIGRYVQINGAPENPNLNPTIKLLTYNVRLFNYYEWDRREHISDSVLYYIAGELPDIVCLQDYITISDRPQLSEQYIDNFLDSLPWKHTLYTYRSGETFKYGLAMYSRFPIVKKGSVRFNKSNNSFIYSDIKIHDDTIRVYNVHLQSIKFRKNYYYFADSLAYHLNSERLDEFRDISNHLRLAFIKRAEQVDELEQHIRRSPYPVIMCGDFNDTPVSYTYQTFKRALTDAFVESGKGIGVTYRGNLSSFRIDYILHSKVLRSINYRTDELNYSDHYPVTCELVLDK